MSWTIRVNFGELFEIGRQFYKYGQALDQMESALENAEKILAENRGLAAEAIMMDTSGMKEKIRKCKKEVSDVQNIIKDYVGDMEEILHPKNENAEMLVDKADICANIESMKNVVDQLNFTTMSVGGLSRQSSMTSPSEVAAMAANAEKLSEFMAEAANTRSRMEGKGRDLDAIYNKVKQFENKDDDYGMRAGQLYDKYSNGKEIAKDQWSAFWSNIKGSGKGVLDLAKDTVVGLCKLVYNIGKAGVATQMVAICGLTGTKPPDWVYKELEGIDRTAKTLLYDPMLAVEGMAQSSKDTYQKEGLAYCIGYVGGDVALSILATKGVNKIGSIGKVGAKLEDIGDIGKAGREIDKANYVPGIGKWEERANKPLYNKYKEIFDDPKFYRQKDGNIIWPPNDGFKSKHLTIAKKGDIYIRRGSKDGKFMSSEGTLPEELSLAPHTLEEPVISYKVVEPFDRVSGKAESWFNQPGNGEQFYGIDENGIKRNVQWLIKEKYLKRIR
ncbi:MAG: TNT domain-containing protein [Eubacteriaceae bacterium]|nr:TNT domain-containing protein [Eubacteriaceae bacterium]